MMTIKIKIHLCKNRPKYGAGISYSPYFGVPGAREGNLYIERAPGTREI